MNGPRRFLGFVLYLFMGFPMLIGGLAVTALKPIVSDPLVARSLVADQRFEAILKAPELAELADKNVELGGMTLDGGDVIRAVQDSVPAGAISKLAADTVEATVRAAGSGALAPGGAGVSIDLRPWKSLASDRADEFAAAYLKESAGSPPALPGAKPGAQVPKDAVETALTSAVRQRVETLPDSFSPEERVARTPSRRTGFRGVASGVTTGGLGLIITGVGFALASALISEKRWGRRFTRLGSRLIVPGAIVLAVGLLPRLAIPGMATDAIAKEGVKAFPALVEYLRFLSSTVGKGFLMAGLASIGAGIGLSSLRRAIPAFDSDDESDE